MGKNTSQLAQRERTVDLVKQLVGGVSTLNCKPEDISDHADLFDDCGLDSISIIDMVLALESKFGIVIAKEEMDSDVFRDLARLADFIDAKKSTTL